MKVYLSATFTLLCGALVWSLKEGKVLHFDKITCMCHISCTNVCCLIYFANEARIAGESIYIYLYISLFDETRWPIIEVQLFLKEIFHLNFAPDFGFDLMQVNGVLNTDPEYK